MSLHLLFLLIQQLHLWCLLELLRNVILATLLLSYRFTACKLFASNLLQVLDLSDVKIDARAIHFFLIVLRRVLLAEVSEKFEVHKLQEGTVELKEGAHHFVINIKGKTLVELVWCNPSDWLTHYLYLVVDTLY